MSLNQKKHDIIYEFMNIMFRIENGNLGHTPNFYLLLDNILNPDMLMISLIIYNRVPLTVPSHFEFQFAIPSGRLLSSPGVQYDAAKSGWG